MESSSVVEYQFEHLKINLWVIMGRRSIRTSSSIVSPLHFPFSIREKTLHLPLNNIEIKIRSRARDYFWVWIWSGLGWIVIGVGLDCSNQTLWDNSEGRERERGIGIERKGEREGNHENRSTHTTRSTNPIRKGRVMLWERL